MIATLFGSIGGLVLGVSGGGGAIITIPLLVYCLHVPIHQALLFSLFVVSFTALAGLLPAWRWKDIQVKIALVVSAGGVIVAPFGAKLSQSMNEQYLMLGFSLLMLVIGSLLWFKETVMVKINLYVSGNGLSKPNPLGSWYLLLLCGAMTGFLTGFFGIGGGFFIVPSLAMVVFLPIRQAITTSLLIIFIISSAGIASHIQNQSVDWNLLFAFLSGSVVGVWAGAFTAKKLSERRLHQVVSALVMCLGVCLFIKHVAVIFLPVI